jgi:hypothetical protein
VIADVSDAILIDSSEIFYDGMRLEAKRRQLVRQASRGSFEN